MIKLQMPRFKISRSVRFALLALLLLGLWALAGLISVWRVNEPKYTVIDRRDGYEIRSYPAYVTVQTKSIGPFSVAVPAGEHELQSYLDGNNTKQESIAVQHGSSSPASEKVFGQLPFLTEHINDTWTMAVILPNQYTIVTAPRPNDPALAIEEVPARTVAVLTFAGWLDQEILTLKSQLLLKDIAADDRMPLSAAVSAHYAAAWVPAFLQRNEIQIPIK